MGTDVDRDKEAHYKREIFLLKKAARLIHDRHYMISGSLEMAECDAVCGLAGLTPWAWPIGRKGDDE